LHPGKPIRAEDEGDGDWIRALIAARCDAIVSDHPSLSERLGLDERHPVTLRFIADRGQCHCFIFTIRCEADQWLDVQNRMVESDSAADTFAAARALLGPRTFVLISCPRTRGRFRVSSNMRKFFSISEAELRKILCRIHPALVRDLAAGQAVAPHVEDCFLAWTHVHLAEASGVYPIDAVQIAPRPILYTLRPTSGDVSRWLPCAADEPAYAAMLRVAEERRLPLNVVAYPPVVSEDVPPRQVALHTIQKTGRQADASPPVWIEGEQLVCEPEQILLPFPASGESRKRYRADA
jgi:hypothetical protein